MVYLFRHAISHRGRLMNRTYLLTLCIFAPLASGSGSAEGGLSPKHGSCVVESQQQCVVSPAAPLG
jgi:hypothetical protein